MNKLGKDIKEWEPSDFNNVGGIDKNPLQNQGNVLVLCMAVRQVLIMALGAIEDYMGHDRTIVPRRKR